MRSGPQPVVVGLAREAVARHRRDHDVEGVRGAAAVGRGIGERLDDLQLLDDRAGPAVRHDQRQGVFVLRADVDEVDVQPVDLGDEVRHGVEPRLDLAPVVVGLPVAQDLLDGLERHALRKIGDGLLLGQPGLRQAAAQVGQLRLRNVDAEGSNGIGCGRGGQLCGRGRHGSLLVVGVVCLPALACGPRPTPPRSESPVMGC